MSRDTIFSHRANSLKFQFDDQVAEVFDDMLDRSVPFYHQVRAMSAGLLKAFLQQGDTVYDLGCSTGLTLIELAKRLSALELQLVGVDNSRAMLDKAKRKAEMFRMAASIRFIEEDITRLSFAGAGGVILNYTLQFVPLEFRQDFMKRVYRGLRPGGVLILSEKVVCSNIDLDARYIDFHHQYKRDRGYSELEIANKREALENVLLPVTVRENVQMLEKAGFSLAETFFQWFNFVSFVALKS